MTKIELRKSLEAECDYLTWQDLEKHFARGAIRVISTEANLINNAIDIAENNTQKISTALENNSIYEPSSTQALHWQQHNSNFLCVVVAPFVLIQESEINHSENTDSASDKT